MHILRMLEYIQFIEDYSILFFVLTLLSFELKNFSIFSDIICNINGYGGINKELGGGELLI
jgi:hypothetical protein